MAAQHPLATQENKSRCSHQPGSTQFVRDPVCGMKIDPNTSRHQYEFEGQGYYFCSAGCRAKFMADPRKYLAGLQASKTGAAPEGTIYTCPMHPQIRQVGPGNCPICGMALEPEVATAETGPSPELVDMTRRFSIGLALAVPVFVLEMAGHLPSVDAVVSPQVLNWIELVLATPVVVWAGWPFFQRGWASVRNR